MCTGGLETYKLKVGYKWMNDVMVEQGGQMKKISGNLCEAFDEKKDGKIIGKLLAIGVGININRSQEALNLIDQPATSMLGASKSDVKFSVADILEGYSRMLLSNLQALYQNGFDSSYGYISSHLLYKGKPVKIFDLDNLDSVIAEGTLEDIDSQYGFLKISGHDSLIMNGRLRLSM